VNGVDARRFVWSDPEIQELARSYVSVADELHRLRTGSNPEALYFQAVFAQKKQHPGHQGVFICTPSGRLLGSCVTWDVTKVESTLRDALEEWNTLGDRERFDAECPLPVSTELGREQDLYPEDGLVLRVTTRDLVGSQRSSPWSRSFVWFNHDELMSMAPSPDVGARHRIPEPLAARIAALCMVDKGRVDGFTRPYRESDVQEAWISTSMSCGSMREFSIAWSKARNANPISSMSSISSKPSGFRSMKCVPAAMF